MDEIKKLELLEQRLDEFLKYADYNVIVRTFYDVEFDTFKVFLHDNKTNFIHKFVMTRKQINLLSLNKIVFYIIQRYVFDIEEDN